MAQVGLLEDNPRIAKLCATLLQFAGHEVTIYDTSRKCLQALAQGTQSPGELSTSLLGSTGTHPLPVDVLIMDLSLPDIDGIDVLRYLTSHSHTQTLPLILCTAATNSECREAVSIANAGFGYFHRFRSHFKHRRRVKHLAIHEQLEIYEDTLDAN